MLAQTVVLANVPMAEALRINACTHAAGIPLVAAETRGVFARMFSDFGDSFTCVDTDGEGCSPVGAVLCMQ